MKDKVFNVVLLVALPASGKSEVRNLMANIDPEELKNVFHIGDNLQLDDFPYVFVMRRIDEELEKLGEPRIYYPGEDPFYDGRDWGTLGNLLNEDYHDLINRNVVTTSSAAEYLFERIDRASQMAGLNPRLGLLNEDIRKKIAEILEPLCRKMLDEKHAQYTEDLTDKTIIIEMARGGQDGASMPLIGTAGYQYTFAQFSPEILENAAVMYIWVSPEESRRKNIEREDPNDPGSSIGHVTPMSVMLYDYGCDDMEYLLSVSDIKDTIVINAHDKQYHLPVGVFDNRIDMTTFLRQDPENWDPIMVEKVTQGIKAATETMWKNYK